MPGQGGAIQSAPPPSALRQNGAPKVAGDPGGIRGVRGMKPAAFR